MNGGCGACKNNCNQKVQQLEVKLENISYLNNAYQEFIHAQGLEDEFGQFMVQQIEKSVANLRENEFRLM